MKKMLKRSMAIMLVLLMAISVIPITAAAETDARITVKVTETGGEYSNFTTTPNPAIITIGYADLDLTKAATPVTNEFIQNKIIKGIYVGTATEPSSKYTVTLNSESPAAIDNTPGKTTTLKFDLNVIVAVVGAVKVADFTVVVSNDLKYGDYTATLKIYQKKEGDTNSTLFKTLTYDSATPPESWDVSFTRAAGYSYTYVSTVSPKTGSPAVKLTAGTGAEILKTTNSIPLTVKFNENSGTVLANYLLRKSDPTLNITQLPAVGITIGGQVVYDNSEVEQWKATGTYDLTKTTAFTNSFNIPVTNSTTAQSEGGQWTITKAEINGSADFGECKITGTGAAQTVTYYPALDAAKTTQNIKFTLHDASKVSTETGTDKTFVLALSFAASAITPTYAAAPTTATSVTVNSTGSYGLGSAVTGLSGFGTEQKQQFTVTISAITKNNGTFMINNGLSYVEVTNDGTVKVVDQQLSTWLYPTIYYKATKGASSTTDYDSFKVTIKNGTSVAKEYTVNFLATAGVTPTYNTSLSTTSVVDSYKTVYLSNAIKNYSSLTEAQKGKFTYTISGFDVNHGYLYVGSGTTSANRVSSSTSGEIASSTYFTYRPTYVTTSSNYDSLTLNVSYDGGASTPVKLKFYATASSDDCYTKTQFSKSYGDSTYGKYAFGVTATNSASGYHTFDKGDFDNDSVDIYNDYYNYYLYITKLPIGGTLEYDDKDVDLYDYIPVKYVADLYYDRYSASDTGIDSFSFKLVSSSSKTSGTEYTMWIVGDSTLLDDDDEGYTTDDFKKSYPDDNVFGVYAKSDFDFDYDDFDNGDVDISDEYEDYYIQITSLPTLGDLKGYEAGKSSKSTLAKNDIIDIADLDELYYDRDTSGIDRFTFKIAKNSSASSYASTSTFYMWIVNDSSLLDDTTTTTKATLTALDFTVSTYEKEEIDLTRDDFVDAFGLGKSVTLSKVYITELPKDGDLYYGSTSTKVDKGDSFSAANLNDLFYVPDGDSTDYTDSFTWYGVSTNGDYSNSAYGSIYVFADESDYDEIVVSGSFSAYMDDNGEIDFADDYFECAFDAAGTKDSLDTIYIMSIPASGTLFDINHEITSSDVNNGYEMDVEDLYYEGSASKTASFKYMANFDDTDEATQGTISIQKPIETSSSTASSAWSATGTTSPVYTVSKAAVSSGTASVTLGSSFVTEALKNCNAGSNLTIVISPASTANGLTLSIDGSLFTTANALKIPYITLSEGTNGASVQISVADFISAVGTGKTLTLELDKLSVTVANSMVASTATAARSVTVKAGTASVSFPSVNGMVLAIPYTNSSSYSDEMVVMYDYTGSNTPIVSSEFTGNMVYASISTSGKYLVAVNNVSFTDTASNWAWTRGYIANLAARGTINGYTDNTYKPDASVTRAEFIKLLIVSLGLEDSTANCTFADMTDHWAYRYVAAAYELGIVDSASEFKPDVAITRQDMALFAYRAAKSAGLTLSSSSSSTTFADESQITGEYFTAVKAMQGAGIINGMAGTYEGYYKPLDSTKRADASKIIWFLNALLYDWSTSGKY